MKTLTRTMVCLYVAVAVFPLVAMELKLHDRAIFGAVPPTPKPRLSLEEFRSEDYQKAFTAWFEGRLGLKGYSVATDNSILYHVFHETKPGSAVVIGERGVLFKDEDIAHYNKDGDALPSQATVDALAGKLGALQAKLRAHQRALVPLIIPSKTTLYGDTIPAVWRRPLGKPQPSDQRIYAAMKQALDARKIAYVDARGMFTSGGVAREELWGPTGRHWTNYGACLALREVMRTYAALTGKPALPYDCQLKRRWQPTTHDDFDLWRLLNTWAPPRPNKIIPLVEHEAPPGGVMKPSVMFIGTSFCWNLLYDGSASQLFGSMHMDYYDKTLVAWPENVHTPVRPHSKEWRDVFLAKDLYVLDLLEVYLLAPDTYVDHFLDELGAEIDDALDGSDATAEPLSGATITSVIDLGVTNGAHYFELWGDFPNSATSYTASVTCDGVRREAGVYYQNPKGGQLNINVTIDPGTCDRTQTPPRISGVSCSFQVRQGATIGSPPFGPRHVCPGPQGSNGQDAAGQCVAGLSGC